ncbi:hypothetical protein ACJ73_00318 [Blastomyces percursus]|uniref:Uncharacterized protein n=1 Tax=Blastomyces percursus TaxID=1658174 RepID=A0A1J9QJK8_9EURO|nr:hypothetical protein ACJ73_00318 [Blastomyces percursus]
MTFSESPMPGTFILDSPIPPKLDLAGARSQFYRSPQTPSAASSLYRSVGPEHQGSRKRARYGYGGVMRGDGSPSMEDGSITFTTITPATTSSWGEHSTMSTTVMMSPLSRIASPMPLVNTDYCFAGGADFSSFTPGLEKPCYEENGPEVDYRPNRYRDLVHTPMDSPSIGSLSPMVGGGRDGNGNSRKRGRRESLLSESLDSDNDKNNASRGGWGSTVVKIVGGVAGKVWDFCWSGPLRGFYAGGGKGYQMGSEPQQPLASPLPPSQVVEESNAWQNVCEKDDDVFSSSGGRHDGGIATVPGHFPVDSFHKNPRVFHHDHDELQGNWVLVRNAKNYKDAREDDMSPSSTPPSARKISRKSNSITPRRVAVGRLARRQPLLTPARPSSSSSSSNHHPHYHQLSSSHGKASHEPAKLSSPIKYGSSPASIEAQRLAARAKRREREEDASIRRLNQQLKAMIKQGKEALGTTIEIENVGMDMEDWD